MGYNPLLTQRAVLLFGLETTPGVLQTLTPAANAVLVDAPDYTINPQKIERKFSKADLSAFPFRIGRIMGQCKFSYEIRGNGLEQSSLVAQAPMLATLMAACGFVLAPALTAADRTNVYPDLASIGVATWAVSGTVTNVEPAMFTMVCTTAGNAATARFTLSCNNPNLLAAPVSAQAISGAVALGTTGVSVTATVSSNYAVGDIVRFSVMPEGVSCKPVSTNQQTASIKLYYDGLMHTLTGAFGTFSFSVDAGGVGKIDFTFMGIHNAVVDSAMPTNAVYDSLLPPLFENALLTWGDNNQLAIGAVSFDMSATMAARDDANAVAGYRGYQYTGRAPKGGFTPEATLTANNDFWGDFANAAQKYFFLRIGTTPGNSILMECPRAQTASIKYADRNSDRVYDLSVEFARVNGNDEVLFYFC